MLNLLRRIFKRNDPPIMSNHDDDLSRTIEEAARYEEYYAKIGTTIGGRFEIHDLLGRGGFGVVYLAYCAETGFTYALKTFLDEYAGDAAVRDRFDKEVGTWIGLDKHPNIVRAYFADQIAGRLYLGLEFIPPSDEGYNTLDGYLRTAQPNLLKTLQWAVQFCHGMEYAYLKGMKAHRDIKPANIMLDRLGQLKISDFGLAGIFCLVSADKKAVSNCETTAQGIGFGTPTHMPPEQFLDAASADERSDIYSFGVVLYQLESGGKLPFAPTHPDGTWRSLFEMHCKSTVPRVESPLFPIIQSCLAKERRDRVQSFKELRANCERLLIKHFGREHVPPKPEAGTFSTDDLIAKGYSLDAIGRHQDAIECYDAILRKQNEPVVMNNMALALIHLTRYKDAVEWCDRALAASPGFENALINRAVALEGMGRLEESLAMYRLALRKNKRFYLAWYNAGNVLFKLGKHNEANQFFDEAIRLCPDYAPAYSNKGQVLDAVGKHGEAIQCLMKAVKQNPMSFYAWTNIGVCLRNLGDTGNALLSFKKALDLNPRNVVALFEMGNMCTEVGDFHGAMENYNAALKVNPQEVCVLAAKIMTFWKTGYIGDALMFSRMAVLIVDDPQLHFFKGLIEDNAGQKKEAVNSYSRFLDEQRNADVGQVQMAQGRVEHLRAELEIDE